MSELERAVELLRRVEAHLVGMYRGIAPHANDENSNAFADADEMVVAIRTFLGDKQ